MFFFLFFFQIYGVGGAHWITTIQMGVRQVVSWQGNFKVFPPEHFFVSWRSPPSVSRGLLSHLEKAVDFFLTRVWLLVKVFARSNNLSLTSCCVKCFYLSFRQMWRIVGADGRRPLCCGQTGKLSQWTVALALSLIVSETVTIIRREAEIN